jgi:hypothetical protein
MKQPRLSLIAVLLILPGCLIDTTSDGDGVSWTQSADIPIPSGMELEDELHESNTVVNGDYRYENLVYEGKTSMVDVSAFLQQRMPQHAHQLVTKSKKDDDCEVLIFKRGRYTSECTVRRLEFSTRLEIRVRTDLKLP